MYKFRFYQYPNCTANRSCTLSQLRKYFLFPCGHNVFPLDKAFVALNYFPSTQNSILKRIAVKCNLGEVQNIIMKSPIQNYLTITEYSSLRSNGSTYTSINSCLKDRAPLRLSRVIAPVEENSLIAAQKCE